MTTFKNLLVDRNQQITAISAEIINLIKEMKWPIKGTSKDAGFQCEIPASDGNVYKIEVLNDILSLSYMAELLIKAHSGEELTPEEIEQPVIRISNKIANLKGDALLEQLVTTYRHGSLRDPDQKESQAKANELLQEIVGFGGVATGVTDKDNAINIEIGKQEPNEVIIYHEKGQFKTTLADDNVFNCGQLTMLKTLLEQGLIHSSDCGIIAKALRDSAYAATHPEEALQYPAFLCHDYYGDEKTGDILSDAFVILYNGKTLPETILGRRNAKDDPTKKCVKIWTEVPRSAIMVGYTKEPNGPIKCKVHKMREQGGFVLEPSGDQMNTVRDLLCALGEWDAEIDYNDPLAYQYMLGDGWDFSVPDNVRTSNPKHVITKYAERLTNTNKITQLPDELRVDAIIGDGEFSVTIGGVKFPFSEYNDNEAEMFKRFVMAHEIRGFWQAFIAMAATKEESTPYNAGIAEKFKDALTTVNVRNGYHLIVFDQGTLHEEKINDPRYGAYLSMPDRARYFSFNEEDLQEFYYTVGIKQRPPKKEKTEEPAPNAEETPETNNAKTDQIEGQTGMKIVNGRLQPGTAYIPSSLTKKAKDTTKELGSQGQEHTEVSSEEQDQNSEQNS